jgi:hypothetical protein
VCSSDLIRALAAPVKAVLDDDFICVLGAESKIKSCQDLFREVFPALPQEKQK